MTVQRTILVLIFVLTSCASSREGLAVDHECETDAECPVNTVCLHPGDGRASQCLPTCDAHEYGLCEDGSLCFPPIFMEDRASAVCWPGAEAALGAPCDNYFDCARGLVCSGARVCGAGCNTTQDCPLGTYCVHTTCAAPCDPLVPADCSEGTICIEGLCLDHRDFSDCGATMPACGAEQLCDRSMPRGPWSCIDPWDYRCAATGCPPGEVCINGCVPSHE